MGFVRLEFGWFQEEWMGREKTERIYWSSIGVVLEWYWSSSGVVLE